MNLKIIDCIYFSNKKSAHEEIKRVLNFPSYYGNNLDALWDMLTEITRETLIVFVNTEYINEECSEIINTFRDASQENNRIKLSEI